ncbi:MAG: CotH kinase family protein, partial [Ruminococcus sp.]|nr:CotH kinase family protein [Ruminococcus sp.]
VNSKEQHDFIENYINNVYDIMYFAAYNDEAYVFNDQFTEISKVSDISPEEAVRRAVNVDSLADMYIVSELTCDADIYWSSFFMDVDLGEGGDKKLTFEAPWDFDSSMGNKKDRCQDGQGMYAANIVSDVNDFYETINPWLAVLMNEEWFTDIIAEKWTALYDGGTFSRMCSMVQDDAKQYKTAFERNYSKWNNIIDNDDIINELSERSAKCRDQQDAADYLGEWLNARIAYLNGYWHK